ncbi:MAG: hypothetical protein PHV32_11340 [Eubacteriales bacterium]|nr:hypothetical protein [Eubacteriales bacterium]
MKKKHSLAIPLFIISLLFIVGAAVAVLYALKNDTVFDMILLFIAAALMVFVGGIILYILVLSIGKKQNFFLYDYKTKKEISVDELTFEMVEKRLDPYFGIVLSQIDKQDGVFDWFIKAHFNAEMPQAYKPLLIPFIFWAGIKNSKTSEWIGLLQADKDAIDLIENHLFPIGAFDISSRLQYYRTFEESRVDEIDEFLKSKQTYLEETILRYIKDNIVMFQAFSDSKSIQ